MDNNNILGGCHLFQHTTMNKEELSRWKEMSEEERRDFYFERKRKNEIRVAVGKFIPRFLIGLVAIGYVCFALYVVGIL